MNFFFSILLMFVTFFFFYTDIADDQTSYPSYHNFSKSSREPTRLRHLSLRRASGDRTPLTIDMITGVALGPNDDMLNNYLGVLAR